jgi:hypothetical protein
MKRAALLLALFAAGCDDESLPAKVANAQLHGIVAAQIVCGPTCEFVNAVNPTSTTSGMNYRANRLIDGSCLLSASWSSDGSPRLARNRSRSRVTGSM